MVGRSIIIYTRMPNVEAPRIPPVRCAGGTHTAYDRGKGHNLSRDDRVEARVWDMISALLKNPDELRTDLNKMIELERSSMRSDPEREQRWWLDKLAEADRK